MKTDRLKITVLNDDRPFREGLETEHGFSCFVEYDGKKILFDTGHTDIFYRNASKLGIDPESADLIVLSHGDYDHTGGLRYLNKRHKILCHPGCFNKRISIKRGTDAGMPVSHDKLESLFDIYCSAEPVFITDKIIFLGEIERKTDFECLDFPMNDLNGKIYTCPDDTGLAFILDDGLFVLSGCAHSGIVNTAEYAKKISGIRNVSGVLGGFHLLENNIYAEKTCDYMKKNAVKVYLAHCTCSDVCSMFEKEIPENTEITGAGWSAEF